MTPYAGTPPLVSAQSAVRVVCKDTNSDGLADTILVGQGAEARAQDNADPGLAGPLRADPPRRLLNVLPLVMNHGSSGKEPARKGVRPAPGWSGGEVRSGAESGSGRFGPAGG